jgi:hypothetical protein
LSSVYNKVTATGLEKATSYLVENHCRDTYEYTL